MNVTGEFEVKMTAEPPYDDVEGVPLARATFDKRFSGPLEAVGKVWMMSCRTKVENSAGYVALERVSGSLLAKQGTFVLQHTGVMNQGESSLVISVVPDSGTGELTGLSGRMSIQIVNGKHHYSFDFELAT
jgi:hypothetical protein